VELLEAFLHLGFALGGALRGAITEELFESIFLQPNLHRLFR